MAPSLTANSFLLTTSPHSRLTSLKNQNPRRLIVCAKKSDADGEVETEKSNPFRFNFDFGKVSDVKSLIPVLSNSSSSGAVFGKRKDPNTVFVAGATGQAGIRIAQTLLREGFSVRAGVPELGAAQDLARLAVNYKIISTEESKRLNAVESSFQDPESIAKAIGNATKAVVTIGPCENGPTAEVTTSEALQLIQGAQLAGVSHVAIIYDTSPSSFTSTNNVLDGISLFFNNLFSKSQPLTLKEFIEGLIATDLKYTLIKTKLGDDDSGSENSYNFVVTAEGITEENDYKVTKSQIASLVADVFSNTEVAENKVVEVSTSPDAAARPVSELFRTSKNWPQQPKSHSQTSWADSKPPPASSQNNPNPNPTTEDGSEPDVALAPGLALSWEKLSSGFASAVKNKTIELPKVQIATVRGQAKARNLSPKPAVVKKPTAARKAAPPVQPPKPKQSKGEVRNILGGMFQQETIYVDD
ncbi:hypothetical protein SSX86_022427 [Deinandra increscens subsp. villosa]|uniref:NAD(P)-binding domain-containing protein n=1 Tax=Deinandra increscens subsp. villosa TaxID=3103831 RepID=A0AAP0CKD2_9ASTR